MRGLLCIEPLYHQIIAGNKTQTRRSGGLELVNGSKATKTKPAIIANPDDWEKAAPVIYSPSGNFCSQYFIKKGAGLISYVNAKDECKPRYKVGEVLYLKEPWLTETLKHNGKKLKDYYYKFDHDLNDAAKFNNKLFMPQAAARAFIKITAIRCERLLDISDEDCVAEGIERVNEWTGLPIYKNYLNSSPVNNLSDVTGFLNDVKLSFLSLYKFANKVKEVDNIWVFVYEFTYLKDYRHA